ncbi:ImmA/IrrE family metallo-endopeptidase [Pelagerythrobacter sp.]|uniref:ImmA/IrrE family metallo-endopeptidase n=1 Tax=Pelagerythrobacter sp. TaxID=2800702 RepID=UPI0035B1E36F
MSSKLSQRLRELKISKESLARKTSLSVQRAAEIMGGAKADVSEMRQISSGLRLPLQILSGRSLNRDSNELGLLFRGPRDSADEYDITVERIAIFVEACLEILPERSGLPGWLDNFSHEKKTFPAADRLAKIARVVLDEDDIFGPIPNLAQKMGALEGVIVTPLEHTRYEGISLIAGNYCFVFASPRFSGRMLFTLGHEFGHIVSDHSEGGFAHFEKAGQIGSFGRASKVESFVDAFSSCLLLPDVGLGKFLSFLSAEGLMSADGITDREILYVARFFGVSFDVAGIRLENLGLLPAGVTFSLSGHLRKEFGSPEKRADYLGVSPREKVLIPRISPLLSKHLIAALRNGDISVGWASNSFGFSIGEIFAEQAKLP